MTRDYHQMIVSAQRAFALAQPEERLDVLTLQAREILATCQKNDWLASDAIDVLSKKRDRARYSDR